MKLAIDLQGMQSRESRSRGIGRYTKAFLEHLLPLSSPLEYHLYRHHALPDPDLTLLPSQKGYSACRIVTHSLKFPDSIPSAANDLLYKTALLSAQVDAVLLPSPIEVTESIVPDYADFPAALYTVLYDLIPFVFAGRYLADPGTRALYSQKLRNVRRADLVLAISEATRQDAITHLGLKEDRVVYIGAGVSPFFSPLPAEQAEQWLRKCSRHCSACSAGRGEKKGETPAPI